MTFPEQQNATNVTTSDDDVRDDDDGDGALRTGDVQVWCTQIFQQQDSIIRTPERTVCMLTTAVYMHSSVRQ